MQKTVQTDAAWRQRKGENSREDKPFGNRRECITVFYHKISLPERTDELAYQKTEKVSVDAGMRHKEYNKGEPYQQSCNSSKKGKVGLSEAVYHAAERRGEIEQGTQRGKNPQVLSGKGVVKYGVADAGSEKQKNGGREQPDNHAVFDRGADAFLQPWPVFSSRFSETAGSRSTDRAFGMAEGNKIKGSAMPFKMP